MRALPSVALRSCRGLLAAASLILFYAALAFGQAGTASITGTVQDPTGAAIPGATVTVTNTQTGLSRSTVANGIGSYTLTFLPVGSYTLTVKAQGFGSYTRQGIVLTVDEAATLNVPLKLASQGASVTVTAAAPLISTTNPQVGEVISHQEIENLPLVDRNAYDLLELVPGMTALSQDNALGPSSEYVTAGNIGNHEFTGGTLYLLDGAPNFQGLRESGNNVPTLDAIREYRPITNSFPAEYGGFGGAVVDAVTESGTNHYHGTLYEYLRNNALDALPFTTANPATSPQVVNPYRHNEFGGTFGGPIQRNRTFFFASYDGLRAHQTQVESGVPVLTPQQMQGNFCSPAASPEGQLPAGSCQVTVDPTAAALMKLMPLPNQTPNGGTVADQWEGGLPESFRTDELLLRLDHQITANQYAYLTYFRTSGTTQSPAGSGRLPWASVLYTWKQQNFILNHTWTLNAITVNSFVAEYLRNFGGRSPNPSTNLGDFGSSYTIQGAPGMPQLNISTTGINFTDSIYGPQAGGDLDSIHDDLNLVRGRHQIDIGGEINLDKELLNTNLDNWGVFGFNGTRNGSSACPSKKPAAECGIVDFVEGLPSRMEQDAPVDKWSDSWYWALYAQDKFLMTPTFTLNLGLRWEVDPSLTDPINHQAEFLFGQQSTVVPTAPIGLLFVGDQGNGGSIPRGIASTHWNHFAPRLGFVWEVFGNSRTTLHGGFGVYFGSFAGNEADSTSDHQPFTTRATFPGCTAQTPAGTNCVQNLTDIYSHFPGGDPYPYTFSHSSPRFISPVDLQVIAPNLTVPYTYDVSFGVDHQIGAVTKVGAVYVASLSHRLPFLYDLNYPEPVAASCGTASTSNVNCRRPYNLNSAYVATIPSATPGTGQLSTITQVQSDLNANYNSLQLSFQRRIAENFQLRANYSWSKSMDFLDQNSSTDSPVDLNNRHLDYGRSQYDFTHYLTLEGSWNLDYFHGNSWLQRGINGWMLSTIVTLHSGQPLTITTGQDNNLDGVNNDRPNLVGDPILSPHRSQQSLTQEWFNTAAFQNFGYAAGVDGTAGRNFFTGPGYRDIDLALQKSFAMTEGARIEIRGEAVNAFNMVSLGNPNTNMHNPGTFGTITGGQGSMRIIQLGVHITF